MVARSIATYGFTPKILEKLLSNGFRSSEDFEGLTSQKLKNEIDISLEVASNVLQTIRNASSSFQSASIIGVSAYELLASLSDIPFITSGVSDIDKILNGGFPLQEVTEICGLPGLGKTQFAIQLALNVQMPKACGGIEGKAIYIDTEGSFIIQRVAEMATALAHKVSQLDLGKDICRDTLLKGILYFRVFDYQEQHEVIRSLPNILKNDANIRLVVIDSIAFHFRHEFSDIPTRTRALLHISMELHKISMTFNLAVVTINQMTTRIRSTEILFLENNETNDYDTIKYIPALGDSWSHATTNRILLYWKFKQRYLQVFQSSNLPYREAMYQITKKGIEPVAQYR